jgi:hypothetical protein
MPPDPDHDLRILGEALSAVTQALSDHDLHEIERTELTNQALGIIDAMTAVTATTAAGRRIKGFALITYFARTGQVHQGLSISLASDVLEPSL